MSADKPTIKVTLSIREVPAAVLLRMLEECEYVCEAGKLENNTAYIELKRRVGEGSFKSVVCARPAEFMVYPPDDPANVLYACGLHLVGIIEDGNLVTTGDIPESATCCYCAVVEP